MGVSRVKRVRLRSLLVGFLAISAPNFFALPSYAESLLIDLAKLSASQETHMNAPLALQIMCFKKPRECVKSSKNSFRLTKKMEAKLVQINESVNRSIKPAKESIDTWTINPKVGDCDDYVMTKRHYLIKSGLPASSLRPAMVMTRAGERHLVLLIKTDRGDFVLDNLNPKIVASNKAPYEFRKSAGPDILDWN